MRGATAATPAAVQSGWQFGLLFSWLSSGDAKALKVFFGGCVRGAACAVYIS